ncbi:substrate-binding domain-containing protein [Stappia taiwanensis]|uniref:Substrate-binding domain-containing protein n=1 Tax=Stappia taiwanensis TaxID=992267 RepID=A0A838Y3W9_9HYPH|nr:substrate-binding domain-containing protein [Stappia taiwanensis]MBA4613560.1 substrate-binding domain-containing protein [Stappia taiwanensis]GGE96728.1 transcriptional regulator [Stappia taiwanensis]
MQNSGRQSRRITAAQVAEAAGVSRSAVSRAFTAGAYLDRAKREKILKVAQELGYRPNALAAGLQAAGRSDLVAIVTGDLVNHYDAEILARLVQSLRGLGKWPVVLGGHEDLREEDVLGVLGYPLDALVLRGGSVAESVALHCAKLNIPMILSGRVMSAPGVDCVCCDNARGAAMAVRALVARGRRKLGYLGGVPHLSSDQDRRTGFETALAEEGLSPAVLAHADYSFEGGYAAARDLLAGGAEIDGLFCANDAMALGVMAAARQEGGLSIPEDLSIIGFDDISMAAWPGFDLTTVRNDMDETVSQILRLLSARLEAPGKDNEVAWIEPELILRGTH